MCDVLSNDEGAEVGAHFGFDKPLQRIGRTSKLQLVLVLAQDYLINIMETFKLELEALVSPTT